MGDPEEWRLGVCVIARPDPEDLILMGDWCASANDGDTESNEDPGANRVPHGREREREREKSGRLKEKHNRQRSGVPT